MPLSGRHLAPTRAPCQDKNNDILQGFSTIMNMLAHGGDIRSNMRLLAPVAFADLARSERMAVRAPFRLRWARSPDEASAN
jgi:hypothetical protein